MSNKISVIVPIYNAKRTLNRTITSILNQTYKNLEIILINDGSLDESADICMMYSKMDSRIVFINKVNTGVGDTRNVGIENSTGNYICFIDADDTIDKNYLEELFITLNNNNSDIAISKIKCIDDGMIFYPYNTSSNNIYNQEEFIQRFLNFKVGSAVWGKLFKKSAIGNIRFEKINVNEDFIFFWEFIKNNNSFSENGNVCYHYWLDSKNSLTKNNFSEENMSLIRHIDTVMQDMLTMFPNMLVDLENYYNGCLLHNLIIYYNYINSDECSDLYLAEKRIMFEHIKFTTEIQNYFLMSEKNLSINMLVEKIDNKIIQKGGKL